MILILLISDSRQQNEKTEEEIKYELLFGTPSPDGQFSTQRTETESISSGNNVEFEIKLYFFIRRL